VNFRRRRFLALAGCALSGLPARIRAADATLPAWRLAPDGWGEVPAAEIRAVIDSAIVELWRFFPGRRIEPFVVSRGREGPIVHYQRNAMKEIVVQLDTRERYWCQYAYQFSHEFCHILCGFDDDWKGNLWFEESLCEAASLFVLRRMAETWEESPPRESWRSYAPRFREYTEDIIERRVLIPDSRLPAFFQRYQTELAKNPVGRELNGTVSLTLLRMLDATPHYWEAVAWLNSSPSPKGETFAAYLSKWREAAPERCRGFALDVARKFGVAA
jgi:hypothetical protein